MKCLIIIAGLMLYAATGFTQKDKTKLFQTPAYWKQEYETKEKTAPKDVQEKLQSLRKQGLSEKWTFDVGYTDVLNTDIKTITGFKLPTADFVKSYPDKMNPATKFTGLPSQPNFKKIAISSTLPYFDAHTLNIVTPARNQFHCGSCWAFAAVAAFETSYLLKNGGLPAMLDLSEQQVLDCSIPFGCGGEPTSTGIAYIADHYIQPESAYPYNGASIDCTDRGASVYKGRSWGWVGGSLANATGANIHDIKQAICDHGSVISSFYASDLFKAFRGDGVYNHDDHGIIPNHVVQIIGWDDLNAAWLIKNSWGGADNWGADGIGWVAYNMNHIGGYSCWVDAELTQPAPALQPGGGGTTPPPPPPAGFDPSRELPANDIYKIQNVQSGKMVEVKDGLDLIDKGLKVQQYENHGPVVGCDGKNQEWLFIPAGEINNQRVFYIVNNGFLKTLEGGARATVQSETNTIDERWMIIPSGDVFYLQSVATNQYLEIPNGVTNNSEWMRVGPYTGTQNQQFRFTKFVGLTGPQREYTYGSWTNICSAMDQNKVLNITGASSANGSTIQLYDLDATAQNEQWRLERTADGYYKFISRLAPGKCIDVSGWEAANNSQLVNWDIADVEKQKWLIIPVARESGNYIFFNKVSGKCMDIAGATTSNHSVIQTYSFTNGNNQKWKLVPGH